MTIKEARHSLWAHKISLTDVAFSQNLDEGRSEANVFDYNLQSAFIPHWATCKAKGFGKTVGRTKAIRT